MSLHQFGHQLGPRVVRAAFLVLLIAITLGPFAAIGVPGLGDTLNHLARMHILLRLQAAPALRQFYTIQWSPIPYLAMDAVVPGLARIMPLFVAAKVFVAACVLMPFLGAATLHYAVARRFSLVPACALLLGANYLLALGFLNYLFMAGLSVMLFAAWVASSGWGRLARLLVFAPATTLLYFGHAFAFGGYCCAVGGCAFFRAWRARFHPWRSVALDWGVALAQAVPALCFAASLDTAAGAPGKLYSHYGDAGEKLLAIVAPALFLIDPVQIGVLAGCIVAACAVARRVRVHPAIWPAALAVGLAAACIPEILFSTWLTDFRLPLFTAIVLLGGGSVSVQPAARGVLLAVLTVLLVAKSADDFRVLRALDGQIAQMRQVLAALPMGSRLLVANESGEQAGRLGGSTLWTMPLVAVIDRDAFVPYLFTGITTVHLKSELADFSTPQGGPVTLRALADDLVGLPATLSPVEQREGLRVYWHDWPAHFDYLLVEHFYRAAPPPTLPHLSRVAHAPDMDLYRIAG